MSKADLPVMTVDATRVGSGRKPDYAVIAGELPKSFDLRMVRTIGGLIGFSEHRVDAAILDGIRVGYFRPID